MINNSVPIGALIATLAVSCSSVNLSDGGIANGDKKKLESSGSTQRNPEANENTEDAENDNEYRGTAEPAVIAAAYLACGLDDTTLGCNLYTSADQRIAAADREGHWEAKIGGRLLTRGPGRTRVSFIAETGPFVPAELISVTYTGNADAVKTFTARAATMPSIMDLQIFGSVTGLAHRSFSGSRRSVADTISALLSSNSNAGGITPDNQITGFCPYPDANTMCALRPGDQPNVAAINLGRPGIGNIANTLDELRFILVGMPPKPKAPTCAALGRVMRAALCN
ncbi:MAG: hypothetical protein RIQ81_1220 [Pseudomonadota bacterium]|jgi:hypothetical protein